MLYEREWATDNDIRQALGMAEHRSALGGLFRGIGVHAEKCGLTQSALYEVRAISYTNATAPRRRFRLTREMREVMKEQKGGAP